MRKILILVVGMAVLFGASHAADSKGSAEAGAIHAYAVPAKGVAALVQGKEWKPLENGWQFLAVAPPGGGALKSAAELSAKETKASLPVRNPVKLPSWYHAYALDNGHIPVTVVFASVSTEIILERSGKASGKMIRLVPKMHYTSGKYENDILAEEAALTVHFSDSGCVLLRSDHPLASRMLRDLAEGEGGALLLCSAP